MTAALVLNGPNLNLLGRREPGVYGLMTLADVEQLCADTGAELGLEVECRQSNFEGELVEWLHEAGERQAAGELVGVVLNAGAYTHTSIALRDAVSGADVRVVEVHISNVHAREEFRQHSHLSPVAAGVIVGLGVSVYPLALRALTLLGPPTVLR
ncbi:type II 3-dehydroquinate dehydratase [uncultured Friedmanniella sp.]|uniref:type II 3-dehydroquinate dehydratase n=1 Tax=uncultured Friedmanniella sp. TaxID=335381 RepID=UPI0035CC90D1